MIQYGSGTDPYTTVVNMIKSGYANGHWTGTGITSSLARAAVVLGSPTPALNIGLLDFVPNTGLFGSSISFEGQTISTSAILVRLTYMDDLVLAGDMAQANATSDALFFAANYGSGTTWHVGDITHDGVIDTNDALLFAANYVVGLPSLDGTTGNAATLGGGSGGSFGGNSGRGSGTGQPGVGDCGVADDALRHAISQEIWISFVGCSSANRRNDVRLYGDRGDRSIRATIGSTPGPSRRHRRPALMSR